jgi:uncharacterized protein (TIGR02444 family)
MADNGETAPGEAFWQFSIAFYRRTGVAPALIALQDRGAHDVNLILFGLWLGHSGRGRLDDAMIAAAAERTAKIRAGIVEKLREMRRRLKPDPDDDIQALRRGIESLEIDAERAAQYRLAAAAPAIAQAVAPAERRAAAEANLALYLGPADAASEEAARLRQSFAEFLDGC